LPVRKGIVVDADDLLRAEVIQALMCYDCLDFDEFGSRLSIDFRAYFGTEIERLSPLQEDGLVVVDDRGIHITAKGRLLLRSIAMVFDRYINPHEESTKFSKAI
jgi:oxygen-independent coproporphyrinogen-3 oxidase